MQVRGVVETCLYADDLSTAERFYSRVLGLSAFSRGGDRHVFFRCGKAIFLLFNPGESLKPNGDVPPHGANGAGHVAFSIQESEVVRWRQHLIKQEVVIEKEISWPGGGYSIYFRDTSGNSVELVTPQTWGLIGIVGSRKSTGVTTE